MRLIDADKLVSLQYGEFVNKMIHGEADYSIENVIDAVDDLMNRHHVNLSPVLLEELHSIIQTGGKENEENNDCKIR